MRTRLALVTVALALGGLLADGARADDYSRFSDGPRWVARRRGASLERAERLGLGTREAARTLLTGPPPAEWIREAGREASGTLLWPVDGGRYGRGFGFVRDTRPDLRHNGVDVGARRGMAVRAVADGIVAYSDNGVRGFGNCVLIVHPSGWVSVYAHLLRTTVQPGWRVRRGERIGLVGSTGIARGPHLHFELRIDGRPRDPMRYFVHGESIARAEDVPLEETPPRQVAAADDESTVAALHEAPTEAPPDASTDSAPTTIASEPATPDLPLPADAAALRTLLASPLPAALRAAAGDRVYRTLLWPVRGGALSRPFTADAHRAIDVAAGAGTAVRAAADGVVLFAGAGLAGLGDAIAIAHASGHVTVYGSCADLAVRPGDRVARGQWIARVGAADPTEPPHLHFEVRHDGNHVDPLQLLVQVPAR